MNKKRKRSKAPLVLACIALVLALGATAAVFIIKTNEQREKARTALLEQGSAMCTLHVAGADILPSRAEYEGVDEKGREVSASGGSDAPVLIELTSYDDALEFASEPLSVDISISRGGENVFTGSQEYYADFVPPENGVYDFAIAASFEKDGAKAKCDYGFSISYDVQTKVSLSADTVAQGGTLLLIAENVRDPASLAVSVDYPYDPQIELTATGGYAYIPINYMRNAGEYSVTANYDGKTLELPFTVTETEYEVQHLTVSSSTVSSTIGSNNAYDEIAEKFYSLDSHFDPKIYWNENFIQPVEGSITTEYGIKRYTNNSSTPSRHAGIDIANAEGTPIKASNSGVVLFADELQMTGYSIMIEHGMGVHTVYYHMSGLNCKAGDIVERGDEIGYVGATGFATGPHLHFAVMINAVSVSPWYVFDGTSGIYDIKNFVKDSSAA